MDRHRGFYHEAIERAMSSRTLVDLLRWRADNEPERTAYIFLSDGETEDAKLSYGELDLRARAIAALLQSFKATGERVLLVYPSGLDYITAFFGCLYAGATAVPVYPPRQNASFHRLQSIASDARPAIALTTASTLTKAHSRLSQSPELNSLRWLTADEAPISLADAWSEPKLGESSLAFLQYTSGSTATPKGVMVSHGNLLKNERLIQTAFQQTGDSIIAGWLPLYHDMGLIGNVLQPLFLGVQCFLMSPVAFLQNPFRWLNLISRHRVTTSGGPNFAYELCINKTTSEQRATLDLSSWSVAFNGAEPVRAETMRRFAEAFEPSGFRPAAFRPCYGLAEATLLVTAGMGRDAAVVKRFDHAALAERCVRVAPAEVENAKPLVGCGGALPGQRVVIVDPESETCCGQGQVGEIWVSGDSVALGYWNRPEETERVFQARVAVTGDGPFLRTGDLGFIDEGELFVTGRLKDLIIIRGVNHYPQDIELTVEQSHAAMRPGCGGAFSVEVEGDERLAVVQEVDPRRLQDVDAVLEAVRQAVAQEHEVQPHAVALIRPGGVPKTSSGKIRRSACRAMLLEGRLDIVAEWREKTAAANLELAEIRFDRVLEAQDIEDWLVSQLAARLGVAASTIDVNRSMLQYGLDSLMAIELMHSVERVLGVRLQLIGFLQESSIAELAADTSKRLARGDGVRSSHAAVIGDEGGATDRLSYEQRAMWFLHRLLPESPAYNIAVPMRVRGPLDAPALRAAFQLIVDRHECLRTNFTAVDGEPVPQIHQRQGLCFWEEAATGWSEAKVSDYLAEKARRPFDLASGPLFRVDLLRLSSDEHLLQLVVHHIIADFWSLALILRELKVLYQAEKAGTAATLIQPTQRYFDYARWQARMLSGEREELLRKYWETQLAGELPVLKLPYDQPRPARQTFQGGAEEIHLDEALTRSLVALSRNHGATLYMTLLAAFEVLLHRYTGQEDVLVGSVTAGRDRAEWAELVGYFVNPLAMRADLSADPTFESFLVQVRQTVLSALEHQDYPFSGLVERLQPERDLSRSPLFQVMFVLQKTHLFDEPDLACFALGKAGGRTRMGDLLLESISPEQPVVQFDLVMMAAEVGESLAATLQYNTDLFRRETIVRLLGSFHQLLRSIVAAPEQRVSRLNLLPAGERRLLLSEWNETDREIPKDLFVHRLFEAQARKAPDSLAVSSEAEHLSYGGLNERADELAGRLRSLGVRQETLVGVCFSRSIDMVVAALAVLKAGGAYLPLDPAYPPERLGFMLKDSQAIALLTRQSSSRNFADLSLPVICLDVESEDIAETDEPFSPVQARSESLAYMIYTSGSTGTPKGVAVQHAGLANLVQWHQFTYGVSAKDRATLVAGPAFDASVWELWPYLTVGASLHIPDEMTRAAAADLLEWLSAESISVAFLPTALAEELTAKQMPAGLSLRFLLTGGDKFHHTPQTSLPFTLVNHYGPTESTVAATSATIAAGAGDNLPPPIGRPIDNTQIYLLDQRLQLAPIGAEGELYIGGAGLARCYNARPELTAERFIPNEFSREPGARLYKTGDLARYLADGQAEYLGRLDNQVKIRGYRIELGEIEAALVQHPSVIQSVVVARGETPGAKHLVAYFLPAAGASLSTRELRSFLKERVPDYMAPSAFAAIEKLPLTPNGKVDREALPAPDPAAYEFRATGGLPRNPVEEMLADIWAEVLRVGQVGIAENFFELGGHSLLAIQVISRIGEYLQIELPVRTLFESPTVAGLAIEVEAAMKIGRQSQQQPIGTVSRNGALELSFAQQRLWFLDHLEPGNPLYNIPVAVRLEGRLDLDALQRCLHEIVRRHESLRTAIKAVKGRPVQIITPSLIPPLQIIDLRERSKTDREDEARRLANAEWLTGFDLAKGPLLRASILILSEEEHVLLLTMHHIVSDGWSMNVLVREITALYDAFSKGNRSPLPELPVQYADYAAWQRSWLQGEVLEAEAAYWKRQLAGAPPLLELPTDRPRPRVQRYRGATESLEISGELAGALRALGRQEGVTLFMTLLAAFKALLSRYTNQDDILVGVPSANRNRVQTEELIGMFVNTLVLRSDLSGDPSFRELLRRVRESALGAYAHQDAPFEKLVEELQPERNLSHSPLFQVMFTLQAASDSTAEIAGLKMTPLHSETVAAKFDLTLDVHDAPKGLTATFTYDIDLFDRPTIRRMLAHFDCLLRAAVENPEERISALGLLSSTERDQLLVEFRAAGREPFPGGLVAQQFEAQAARRPDAVAVVFEDQSLTYGQLNARANQLAHHLRRRGVGPDVLVGLFVRHSLDVVVGLMGIVKAGGVYLPLDPAYPKDRLGYMIEDARPRVLLSREELSASLPDHGADLVCLERARMEIESEREDNPAREVIAENLSYVIYTSGSTGRPKGVCITQGAAAGHFATIQKTYELTPDDRVLEFASLNFDVSIEQMIPALIIGAGLILRGAEVWSTGEFWRKVREYELSVFNLPPAYWRQLLSEPELSRAGRLRLAIIGGDVLSAESVEEWRRSPLSGARLLNAYGPTETTITATVFELARDSVGIEGQKAPIGRPLANRTTYILDRAGNPSPIGVVGELLLGGEGLSRGYLNSPELTAERFVPDALGEDAGARVYRTGDRARYLRDGNIEFLGRVDHQVKVRGFRIETGEIESVLREHEAVQDAAVVARQNASGENRLAAYLTLEPGSDVSVSELRDKLREKLPEFMLPSAYTILDFLPLTPNGKVDRQALPAPGRNDQPAGSEYLAPRTSTEKLLSDIWRDVLGLERVGVHDNFFELGGHSLLAIQVIAKVSEATRTEIPLREMFEAPTVEHLAAVVERSVVNGTKRPSPSIKKYSREAYRINPPSRPGEKLSEVLKKKRP
jgi:amino acid adenylation domain-containing protein